MTKRNSDQNEGVSDMYFIMCTFVYFLWFSGKKIK